MFLTAALFLCPAASHSADVSFYGVFKAQKYNQLSSGTPTIGTGNPYRVDAVVAPSVTGLVTNATVTPPGSTAQLLTYDPVNQWLSFEAKFTSQALLDAGAPSGAYNMLMSTVNQGQKTETLNLPAETFPPAPHISNWTAGQAINPTVDFKLTWDAISGATTNDYILVLMGEQTTGVVNFRSPSPFQPGALNGTNTSVVISATNLAPNTLYLVEITFVKIKSTDSTSYPGARGIVGFNSFTDSSLMTTTNPTTPGADISFYGVFKAEKYNQLSSGAPTIGTGNPYRIDAVAAPSVTGLVTNATVTPPGGTAQLLTYDPVNQWLSFEAKFASQALLDAGAPSGAYNMLMSTVNQGQKTETLNLPAETFPPAPHISNWTAGQAINPAVDFKLTWDAISGGTTNDYILVLMGEQTTGAVNFRSPSPFQPGALNGTNTSVVIPTTSLGPNTVYLVEITFVKIKSTDSTSYPGARGIVGFNSFTDSNLATTSNPTQLSLSFRSFAQGGNFFADTNATPAFPVVINSYRTLLTVTGTTNFASLTQVLITGPPGSGLTNTASATFTASVSTGFFFSPKISQPAVAPAGTWSVNYAGVPYSFPELGLQPSANLTIPLPKVGLANGMLKSVTWSYYDPLGNPLAGTPAVVNWLQVQALNAAGSVLYSSEVLPAATIAYSFTNTVYWTNVDSLRLVYADHSNNLYLIAFGNVMNPAPAQLSPISSSKGGFTLQLVGQTGQEYVVQFSSDLTHWTDLLTTNLSGSALEILDPQAGGSPWRFYRTRAAP